MSRKLSVTLSTFIAITLQISPAIGQTLSEGRLPTHCRLIQSKSYKLPIMDFGIADIVTAPRQNYEIVKQFPIGGNSIKIYQYDRMYVTLQSNGSIEVEQKREIGGKWQLVGKGKLTMDGSKLWMRGPANEVDLAGKETTVGEYFAFRVSDSGTHHGYSACQHKRATAPFVCKRFHFEFYETNDTANSGHKPSVGYNVVPFSSVSDCVAPASQTGEGDGDNGPEYP